MLLTGAGTRAASLELEVAELGPPGTPADEDVLLNVTVSVGGYAAADQVWVPGNAFAAFLDELADLERLRRGEARLTGVFSEEFELTFFATDPAGHMALRGHVQVTTPEAHVLALRFGFPFEPDRLPQLLADLRGMRQT
ncbi:MAG: hypothetical protein HYZ29_12955 [Myxococcales bacterium]|nr:hypothetical protein [Myxococcales bacterium]